MRSSTKKILPLLLCLFFLSVVAVFAAPRIDVDQSEFTFKPLLEGETVRHTFRFVNRGDTPLVIDRVRTSCGCTAAVVSAKQIAPGEQGELAVTFDSSGFRNQVSKTIYVYTNDPQQRKTLFTMTGQVTPLLDVSPLRVRFNDMRVGEPQQVEVKVTNQGKQPIRLESVQSTADTIAVAVAKEMLAPGEQTTLTVTAQLPQGANRLSGYVMLGTDHPKIDRVRLVVRGYSR